jgi:hypothetical protein
MFKKETGQLLALLLVVFFSYSSYCNAQVTCSTDGSTNPVAGSTTATTCLDPNTNTIVDILDQGDFGTGGHQTGSSHNQMYQMTNRMTGAVTQTDHILHFSYTDDTWVTNMAINQALVGAGFDIAGYTANWQWKNENTNTINGVCTAQKVNGECLDDLVINIEASAGGTTIYSEEWDYSQTKSNGYTLEEVLSFSPLALVPGVTIDQVEVSIRGKDNGFWQGMYGPKVMNFSGGLIVMPDSCTLNGAISDPSCPGYAAALFQQQCKANPLFDSSCPGYTAAYFNLQCSISALYDQACPGYAAAYLKQECFKDPLYDSSCPGYATAYYNQQCSIDPLYDTGCPGYSIAYQNQQCTNDPTSDPSCPDYYVAMCKADPLFDMGCVGYDIAYFDQQCSLDAQFDQTCTGYVDLSGNDKAVAILDPIIDDIIAVEPELDFYEPEIPAFEPVYKEEIVEVEPEVIEMDNFQQTLEDDIEREIAELENEGDAMNMEDDIENEIAQLEDSTSSEEVDFDDPTNTSGKEVMEDDIEKEIAELEQESDTDEGDSEPAPEDEVQVTDSNARPDKVDNSPKSSKRENVPSPSTSKRQKIKWLIAQKAIEATKELENAVTLEQQMNIQRRLLALISFVPDFDDYSNKENVNQVNFYPPKPTVDHAYARWFLNDPNFAEMEDLQYPNLR